MHQIARWQKKMVADITHREMRKREGFETINRESIHGYILIGTIRSYTEKVEFMG